MDIVEDLRLTIRNHHLEHLIRAVSEHWHLLSEFNRLLADCICKSSDDWQSLEAKFEAVSELADTINWPWIIGVLDDDRFQVLKVSSGQMEFGGNVTELQRQLFEEVKKVIDMQDLLYIDYNNFFEENCRCCANLNSLVDDIKSNYKCYSELIDEMIAINQQNKLLTPENVDGSVEVMTINSDDKSDDDDESDNKSESDDDDDDIKPTISDDDEDDDSKSSSSIIEEESDEDDGSYACKWPGCEFKSKASDDRSLRQHVQRMHEKSHKFRCPWKGCRRRFFERFQLKIHLKTHTSDKPIQCRVTKCRITFKDVDRMEEHLKWKHRSDKRDCCKCSGCRMKV